jgi:hypothetical protein
MGKLLKMVPGMIGSSMLDGTTRLRLGGLSDQLITAHMERMRDQVMPALR